MQGKIGVQVPDPEYGILAHFQTVQGRVELTMGSILRKSGGGR